MDGRHFDALTRTLSAAAWWPCSIRTRVRRAGIGIGGASSGTSMAVGAGASTAVRRNVSPTPRPRPVPAHADRSRTTARRPLIAARARVSHPATCASPARPGRTRPERASSIPRSRGKPVAIPAKSVCPTAAVAAMRAVVPAASPVKATGAAAVPAAIRRRSASATSAPPAR
jgi:hypothetical protein